MTGSGMKNVILMGLLVLALAVGPVAVGCSRQDAASDSPASTTAAADQSAAGEDEGEMLVCKMCGGKVARDDAVIVDGEVLCAHCVPSAHRRDDGK